MMKKSLKIVIGLVSFVFLGTQVSFAQLINYKRRAEYQHPGTAFSPSKGYHNSNTTPLWKRYTFRIQSRTERRYDRNRDGKLEPSETRNYLIDVIRIVERRGEYRVDSSILNEYDRNHDGVISRSEAAQIRKDLR